MKRINKILILLIMTNLILVVVACNNKSVGRVKNAEEWDGIITNSINTMKDPNANFICKVTNERDIDSSEYIVYADGKKVKVEASGKIYVSGLDRYPTMYISLEEGTLGEKIVYQYNLYGKNLFSSAFQNIGDSESVSSYFIKFAGDGYATIFIDISFFIGMFADFEYQNGEYVFKEGASMPFFGIYLDRYENKISDLRITFADGLIKSIYVSSNYHHPLKLTTTWVGNHFQEYSYHTNNVVHLPENLSKLATPAHVRIEIENDESYLKWDAVDNALTYEILVNTSLTIGINNTYINLDAISEFIEGQTYELRVYANANKLFFEDSDFSESIIYTK